MAKVNLNQLLEMLTGKLGNLVFRRRPDGTVIVSGKPRYRGRRRHKGTPAQKAHREHVKEVGPYAKHLAKTHPIYAELAKSEVAKGKWLSAYNFAFADCLKPPVIHRIERSEGCIRVEATDNIMVKGVQVTVRDEAGRILEMGDATQAEGDWWEFTSHQEGRTIVAEAWDIPQNYARLEMQAPSRLASQSML